MCSRFHAHHNKQTNLLPNSARSNKHQNVLPKNRHGGSAIEPSRTRRLQYQPTPCFRKTTDKHCTETYRLELDVIKTTKQENEDLHKQLQAMRHTLIKTEEELISTQHELNHSAPTLTEQEADALQMNVEYLEEENKTLNGALIDQEAQLKLYKHGYQEMLVLFESQSQRLESRELELYDYKDKLAKRADDKHKKNDLILSLQSTIYQLEQNPSRNRKNAENQIDESALLAIKEKYKDEIYELQHANGRLQTVLRTLREDNDKLRNNFEDEHARLNISLANFEKQQKSLKTTEIELENCKKRLREISEDDVHKKYVIKELLTKVAAVEQTFQQTSQNDKETMKALESEKSNLVSDYNAEISELKQKTTDMRKRIDHLSKENDTLKDISKQNDKRSSNEMDLLEKRLQITEMELMDTKTKPQKDDHNLKEQYDTINSTLQVEKHELEACNTNLRSIIGRMKQDIVILNNRHESDCNALQKEMHRKEKELEETCQELDNLKKRYSKDEVNTNREIDGLRSQLADAMIELQQMKKEARETMHAAKNDAIDADTEYRNELSRLRLSKIDFERQVENLLKENEKLKTDIDRQRQAYEIKSVETATKLASMERSCQKFKDELDETRTRYSEDELNMHNEIAGLQSKLADAEATLLQMKKESSETMHAAKNKNIEADTKYRNELSRLQQSKLDLESFIETLLKENEKLKIDIDKQGQAYETKSIETTSKLKDMEQSGQKLKDELDGTRTRLLEISEGETYKGEQIVELRTSLFDVEKTFQQTSKSYKERIKALENENSKIASESSNEVSKLKQKTSDLRKHVEDLTRENDTLMDLSKQNDKQSSDQIETLRKRLHSNQMELADTIAKLQQEEQCSKVLHETKIASLQQEKHKLEESKGYLQTENDQMKKYINKLQNRLESDYGDLQKQLHLKENELRITELELRNTSTRFSEEEVNMKNEIAGLRAKLAEMQATLQQMKQIAEERIRALENEKSDTDAQYNADLTRFQQNKIHFEKEVDKLRRENEECKTDIDRQKQTIEEMSMETNSKFQNMERNCQKSKEELNEARIRLQKEEHSSKALYETKITSLQQENHKLEESKAYLNNENDQKKKYIDKLKNRLDSDYGDLKKQLHKKEIELKETKLELENATMRFSEEEVNMKNEIEDLRANLVEVQATLQQTKRDAEERILAFENKKSDMNAQYNAELTRFQQKEIHLEKHVEQLLKENEKCKTDINRQNQTFENMLIETNSRFENMERNCQKYKNELDETKSRMRKISEDNARKNSEIDKLQTSLANEEQRFRQTRKEAKGNTKQIESEKSNLVSQHNKEVTRLQQNINDMKRHIEDLSTENDKLKSYNKQHEKQSSNDIETLKQRLQSTEMDLLDVRKKLQKEKEKNKSQAMYETAITNLKEEKRKLEVCKADLETKNGQMKRDIINLENRLGSNQKSARYSDSDYDALQKQLRRREKELKDTEHELEDTKTRLSKCMGDKLTNNNPNIVDLSDMNRPSKLADRYKELYDNQWTDAYEVLEKSEGTEQHIICILLNVLIETKRFCDDQTHTEMNHILRSITQNDKVQVSDVPVGVLKYIKDCRKSSAAGTMKVKYKEYKTQLRSGSFSFAKQALTVNEYLNECFEICWLMSIQDPPVVLSPLLKHGDSFRTDLYCAYTGSGKIVDYIVWPALLLHENGPTLTKGVAQGMKRA